MKVCLDIPKIQTYQHRRYTLRRYVPPVDVTIAGWKMGASECFVDVWILLKMVGYSSNRYVIVETRGYASWMSDRATSLLIETSPGTGAGFDFGLRLMAIFFLKKNVVTPWLMPWVAYPRHPLSTTPKCSRKSET